MFHYQGKKTRSTHTRSLQDLTAIVSAKTLLADPKRVDLIEKIMDSSALESARFDSLCLKLLHHFADQCQRLPATANRHYSLPGGLLDHALHRTEAALHLLRQQMVITDSVLSQEQTLWLYALFSAAILQGIGTLQLDYCVEMFDINGQFSTQWNPLLETLASQAKYYHFEFTKGGEEDVRSRLNLVLACQLMPKSGFAWIASNPEVLAVWLALLNDDTNAAGMLGLLLERADAIAIHRDLNRFLVGHTAGGGGRAARIGTFIDSTPESSVEKEQALGAEFLKWLHQELKNGRFCINKVPLLLLPAGLLMSPETYQLFMRAHLGVKNWQAVHKGLMALGLQQSSQDKNAVLLKKVAIALPEHVSLFDKATGKEKTVSALEVMRLQQSPDRPEPLQQLTSSGRWEVENLNRPGMQSSFIRGE